MLPTLDAEFLANVIEETEARWRQRPLYGFEGSPGTRWNAGLSEAEIEAYEATLNLTFPTDFRRFVSVMNGTTTPGIDYLTVAPYRLRDVYAFPRDLNEIRQRIEINQPILSEIQAVLDEQGEQIDIRAGLVPIYGHRYVVCGYDRAPVLSIMDTDAIVYGNSLRVYLTIEFLP